MLMEMEGTHSAKVATIYVFNLIVGAGALALPLAFASTGWILGIIALVVLAMMSFITATFMVEAMAIANALVSWERASSKEASIGSIQDVSTTQEHYQRTESSPLIEDVNILPVSGGPNYAIVVKMEMGQMAKMFFNSIGVKLFYVVIALYLYGDLAIYATAVPKSLTLVTCLHLKRNSSLDDGASNATCFRNMTKETVYRLYVLAFTLIVGPFVFFGLGKTKYLQFSTTLFRWLAFILMIALALYHITKHEGHGDATMFDISQLPTFFGVAVYSFMCQHSLPSILTPTKQKRKLNKIFMSSFSLVLSFYLLLSVTAVFCFPKENIKDLYTLNFLNEWAGFSYFLALFPVFTLSSSFPIIAITLRENIKSIFLKEGQSYSPLVDRLVFPLVTVLPPIAVAFITQDVEMLVGVTGSYAGSVIQYVVPVMLVYCGRKRARAVFGSYSNVHRSMFRQRSWVFFVIAWTLLCIVIVTIKHFLDLFKKKL